MIRKFFLSAFVVVTFIGYALTHQGSDTTIHDPVTDGTFSNQNASPVPAAEFPNNVVAPTAVAQNPTAAPESTATNKAPLAASNGLKNGTYTGPIVDVNWGNVQVKATIQNGRISDVQFLQYPTDRRTSRSINSFAVPQLQQEAVQAQTANVDIVTGATLTSEGFQMSLQAALNQAKG